MAPSSGTASRASQVSELRVRSRPFAPTETMLAILAARAAGGSRKEAAKMLGITDGAVAYHLRKLLHGARLHDDAQAIFVFWQDIESRVADHNGNHK